MRGVGLTLAGFLALPSVRDAAPELVVPGPPDTAVRWVHSSEIYEIGPLVSVGDLLLTTGLGLAGVDGGARRYWVRDLAARGVAAVAWELGRSLPELPPEILTEARRLGLPLMVFGEVVPFIRIAEEANTAIVDAEGYRLRLADRMVSDIHAALAAGGGTPAVVACAAAVTGGAALLNTRSGQVVAAAGVQGARAIQRLARSPAASARVEVWGVDWGTVSLGPGRDVDDEGLRRIADRLAGVAAVAVAQSGVGSPGDVAPSLLIDLLADAVPGPRELLTRCGLAGFHPVPEAVIVGLASSAPDPAAVVRRWREVAHGWGMELLAERVRGEVLALGALPAGGGGPDPAGWVAQRWAHPDEVLTVGPAVSIARAGHTLREAHGSLSTATLLGVGPVLTRDLALPRLLAGSEDEGLQQIVDVALSPLLAWDAARGSQLVRTLTVYLRHGSKTRSAEVLGLQRASLHQRLTRIESLLGRPVEDPASHEGWVVATCAVQLLAARAGRRPDLPGRKSR